MKRFCALHTGKMRANQCMPSSELLSSPAGVSASTPTSCTKQHPEVLKEKLQIIFPIVEQRVLEGRKVASATLKSTEFEQLLGVCSRNGCRDAAFCS
jgi:hypothetical protein